MNTDEIARVRTFIYNESSSEAIRKLGEALDEIDRLRRGFRFIIDYGDDMSTQIAEIALGPDLDEFPNK